MYLFAKTLSCRREPVHCAVLEIFLGTKYMYKKLIKVTVFALFFTELGLPLMYFVKMFYLFTLLSTVTHINL